jgi:hypothetical protein
VDPDPYHELEKQIRVAKKTVKIKGEKAPCPFK